MVSILVVGEHITFRADEKLSNKLSNYALVTYGNVYGNRSKAILELLDLALDLKPMLKKIKEDPNKINEILLEIKAKESEQGLIEYINNLTDIQQDGIFKMLEMKRDGTWK